MCRKKKATWAWVVSIETAMTASTSNSPARKRARRDTAAAVRMRRHRALRKSGRRRCCIDYDEVEVPEALIEAGLLSRDHVEDGRAVARAISAFLDISARRMTRSP
jgi:hypothetical protein